MGSVDGAAAEVDAPEIGEKKKPAAKGRPKRKEKVEGAGGSSPPKRMLRSNSKPTMLEPSSVSY